MNFKRLLLFHNLRNTGNVRKTNSTKLKICYNTKTNMNL